ncbi:MAG: N-acyl homoserine lactonase family protein [Bacteroidetes bacterium]|jgi:N-acyl homoserine lactone hydrolase|nr:N-acyl homoserine lactonase family protein [Bacteroidota bacterium]
MNNQEQIKLYIFNTGVLKCKENNIKMNASLNPYEIPVPWFLIKHPKGNIIIDGGNAVECATTPRDYWGDICDVYWPEMSEQEGCVNTIKNLGLDPESVRFVLQSHLHLDHTGAIGRFSNATHVVHRKEYEYAFTPDWFAKGGYIKNDFDKTGLDWDFIDIEHNGYYDLMGDQSVLMVPTPGHSPGHCSFVVNLPQTGSIILTADAAYTTDHWEDKALPGFLTSAQDAARSVVKLRSIARRTNAFVMTGHDPVQWKDLKKGAADFYR